MSEIVKTPDGYALADGARSCGLRWLRSVKKWQYFTSRVCGVAGTNRANVIARSDAIFLEIEQRQGVKGNR